MKFRFILTFISLFEFTAIRGNPELSPISEYSERELKREKRTLTTICVEIKPSDPYEQPYFMCKGTDTPHSSKAVSYSGSQPLKPAYKPNLPASFSENDHHDPVKTNYEPEHSKYGTSTYQLPAKPSYEKIPSYSNSESHPSYSNYESAKPSYGKNQYVSHDGYSMPISHLSSYSPSSKEQDFISPTYGSSSSSKVHDYEPTAHYDTISPSKTQDYDHPTLYGSPAGYSQPNSYDSISSADIPKLGSYGSNGPTGYTKSSFYDGSDSVGYPKPNSYGSDDSTGYYKPNSDKVHYSKPSSYGSSVPYNLKKGHGESSYSKSHQKPSSGIHSSVHYAEPNSYSSKPGTNEHANHASYSPYSSQKHLLKPTRYTSVVNNPPEYHDEPKKPSKPTHHHSPSKPAYSLNHQGYRALTEDMMMPMWDSQQPEDSSQMRSDSMEDDQQPLNIHYANDDQSGPRLQAAAYDPYNQPVQYAPVIPSYQPAMPSTQIATPTYTPYFPVPYSPLPISYAPPLQFQAYRPPAAIPLLKPTCPQSYLYSLQPTIIPLPCYSSESTGAYVGAPHQFQQTHINPLHDVSGGRSPVSEIDKPVENISSSAESEEATTKKPDAENDPSTQKQETQRTTEATTENPPDKNTDQAVVNRTDKPKEDTPNGAAATKEQEDGDTKVAYEAMIKMAKLAAQLKKDPDDE